MFGGACRHSICCALLPQVHLGVAEVHAMPFHASQHTAAFFFLVCNYMYPTHRLCQYRSSTEVVQSISSTLWRVWCTPPLLLCHLSSSEAVIHVEYQYQHFRDKLGAEGGAHSLVCSLHFAEIASKHSFRKHYGLACS